MKLGLLARADKTGLGYQTLAYYKHLQPAKTLLVDIGNLNGNASYYQWYSDAYISKGMPTERQLESFMVGLDVLLTAETPYNYNLYEIARRMGVKTVCVPNWEFFDYYLHPHLPKPDMLLAPSVWHLDDLKSWGADNSVKIKYLHLPVDRADFPYINRSSGKTIHIAGKPATNDRNGTMTYLQAVPDGKVTTQDERYAERLRRLFRHSKIYSNLENPQGIYHMGDILVYPRRYGGNSLPLNEALSTGMPVIMPDVSPNNHLLPQEWLVPAHTSEYFTPRTKVDLYDIYIADLQAVIERVQGRITQYSEQANAIADTISWETLKSEYIKTFEELCEY